MSSVITPELAIACGIKPSALKACADWNDQASRNRGKATTDADRQRHRHQAALLLETRSKMGHA